MKPRKPSYVCNSFEDLKKIIKTNSFSLSDRPSSKALKQESKKIPELEGELFNQAMEGVTPLSRENYVERISSVEIPEGSKHKEEVEALEKLTNLVKYGVGFNVADTPEYIEGTGYHVHPEVARRLHRGDFSIQAHIDLHGLCVNDAKEVFDKFLKGAVITGKRGVLIVHGRGLSSPSEPVLKKKVEEWLTRGPWRKWIVAYSSARHCDGGAGATYVLLRHRPVSKRFKVKKVNDDRKS